MEILEIVYRLTSKYNQKAKKPKYYGTEDLLYPAEVHMIEIIGAHANITTTALAEIMSVTKGAVSQTTNKLLKKELIVKNAPDQRTNEVYITLSEKGKIVFSYHRELHRNMTDKINAVLNRLPPESIKAMDEILAIIEESLEEI